MTRGVVAVLPCAIAMTLGVVTSGCADPEGDYEDFLQLVTDRANAQPPVSDTCLGTASKETLDLNGTFVAYCRVNFAAASEALRLRADIVQADATVSITLEPLKIGSTSATETVGDPQVTATTTLEQNKFAFSVGTVNISGTANPLSGSDIQLDDASFKGIVISADEMRAELDGKLIKPFELDLTNPAQPDICVFYRLGADLVLPTPPEQAALSCQP